MGGIAMTEYRAIYKCRMCGKEYESHHTFDDEVLAQAYSINRNILECKGLS